ncbi:MAG: cytochrome c [Porticoccaceae bacterium]|nr:cytochrome c [Porticoccaceae bacterium]
MSQHRVNVTNKITPLNRPLKPGICAGIMFVVALLAFPQPGLAGADDSPAVDWGRDLYMSYCVSCHGWTGTGDGPAGLALKTPPADLTQLSIRNGGEFPKAQVKRYIEGDQLIQAHGSRQMPVWGKTFRRESTGTEARMQYFALAEFLKSIQASPKQ